MRVRIVRRNIIEKHSFVCHHVQRFSEISRNVRASLPGSLSKSSSFSRERIPRLLAHVRKHPIEERHCQLYIQSFIVMQIVSYVAQSPFQRDLSVSSSFSSEVSISKSLSLVKIVARLIVKAIGCKSEIAKEREREKERKRREGRKKESYSLYSYRIIDSFIDDTTDVRVREISRRDVFAALKQRSM